MKKIFVCIAALALSGAPALAQQNGEHGHEGERGALRPGGVHADGAHTDSGHRGAGAGAQGPQGHAATPQAAPQPAPQAAPATAQHGRSGNNDRGRHGGTPGGNNYGSGMAGPSNGMRGPSNDRNNGMRGPSRNYGGGPGRNAANFNQYHRNFASPRRYRAPQRYVRPQGWYSHRWTYGERLPSAFFVRNYWIDDFEDFGLIDPPYGTTWVRYGADALLVDEDSGEVVQVVYGVFY